MTSKLYLYLAEIVCNMNVHISTCWNFQDLKRKPKYLVTFTVGFEQKNHIDASLKKVTLESYYIITSILLD